MEVLDNLGFPVLRVREEWQEKVAFRDCLVFRAWLEETVYLALQEMKDAQEASAHRVL